MERIKCFSLVGGSTNITLDSHSQSFCVTFKWDRDGEMETGYTGALVLFATPHVYKSTAYSPGVWQRPMPPHTTHAWWVFTPFLTGCSQMTEPNLWRWGWDPGVCSPCWGFIFRPHIEQPLRTLPLPAHICFFLKQYSITLQFWRKLSTTPLDHVPLSLWHNAGRGGGGGRRHKLCDYHLACDGNSHSGFDLPAVLLLVKDRTEDSIGSPHRYILANTCHLVFWW